VSFRLSKKQQRELHVLRANLAASQAIVEAEEEALETHLLEATSLLNGAIRHYNSVLILVRSFVAAFAEEAREEFEDRSERWQESDAGQAAQSFIEEWEQAVESLDDLAEIKIVMPDALAFPDLDDLPEEAES
jgi:uncharacterized membrane-anchored protein YhcB (DUF1043 family)